MQWAVGVINTLTTAIATFNSLFEMPAKSATAKAMSLCAAFNSLFEMPLLERGGCVSVGALMLSILYLRCTRHHGGCI